MSNWTVANISDLSGKVAIVTGANSGLGYEVARGLAGKGAKVILACLDLKKGAQAAQTLTQVFPNAQLDCLALDLADLNSVRAFADTFGQKYSALHILCNNAGVMAIPYRQTAQ